MWWVVTCLTSAKLGGRYNAERAQENTKLHRSKEVAQVNCVCGRKKVDLFVVSERANSRFHRFPDFERQEYRQILINGSCAMLHYSTKYSLLASPDPQDFSGC